MTISIIGLGLIGGSMAIDLRAKGFAHTLIGVDANAVHRTQAIQLGLVDEVLPLEEAVAKADIVIIAIPVDKGAEVLLQVLNVIKPNATVIDTGSTKASICAKADTHTNRKQFVAAHPIAGTEYNGPQAALKSLFTDKLNIICEKEKSGEQYLRQALELFDVLEMRTIYMNAEEHDRHLAFVSHLSHISSFTLGLTVLDIEENEKNILQLAGSGFESTVRLAKSSPDMWAPILSENGKNLSEALASYINILGQFKQAIDTNNSVKLKDMMTRANDIKRVLKK